MLCAAVQRKRQWLRTNADRDGSASLNRKLGSRAQHALPNDITGGVALAVLTIRAHRRFAVCRKARVEPTAGKARSGLLIELSLEGCRVSDLGENDYAMGDVVRIAPQGGEPFEGQVRWQQGGTVGLKLVRPFHISDLQTLIRTCRGEFDGVKRAG